MFDFLDNIGVSDWFSSDTATTGDFYSGSDLVTSTNFNADAADGNYFSDAFDQGSVDQIGYSGGVADYYNNVSTDPSLAGAGSGWMDTLGTAAKSGLAATARGLGSGGRGYGGSSTPRRIIDSAEARMPVSRPDGPGRTPAIKSVDPMQIYAAWFSRMASFASKA